jgi:hypothetical protein
MDRGPLPGAGKGISFYPLPTGKANFSNHMTTLQVFDQHWNFTPAASHQLQLPDTQPEMALKFFIIQVLTGKGLEVGTYEIDHPGGCILIEVTGDQVHVDAAPLQCKP